MTALTLRGVSRHFGDVAALSGIDLAPGPGSRTAIVGPSGSGKTTLLRLIAGFEVQDEGVILLDGQVVARPDAYVPAHLRNSGLVMQDGALFPHLSVLDNIRFGIGRRGNGTARAIGLLDRVELDRTLATRQPHELSGGQQQRVALARARRPRLMLLDEPFSALDAGLREQMRQATAGILERAGIATILVTHDQEEAMSFGSQLVVPRGGRLIQSGLPSDLYRAPGRPGDGRIPGRCDHSRRGPDRRLRRVRSWSCPSGLRAPRTCIHHVASRAGCPPPPRRRRRVRADRRGRLRRSEHEGHVPDRPQRHG